MNGDIVPNRKRLPKGRVEVLLEDVSAEHMLSAPRRMPAQPAQPSYRAPVSRGVGPMTGTNRTAPPAPVAPPAVPAAPQGVPPATSLHLPRKPWYKRIWVWLLILLVVVVSMVGGAAFWYVSSLSPYDTSDTTKVRIEIPNNTTTSQIADKLAGKQLIRSSSAFNLYMRTTARGVSLKAGTYTLSPSMSVEEIVSHFISGKVDTFRMTFYPGATLSDTSDTPLVEKTDVVSVLIRSGYSESEIASALAKTYNHPLMADKPAGTDLEGYVFGETYEFFSSNTVEEALEKTFDEYYQQLRDNNLIEGYKERGLSVYQGITLASIIQKELPAYEDQRKAAQIFLKRLSIGMPLGSDVTYHYGAKKLGVDPTPELESPYNTRKVVGLPPGPISSPGLMALKSVANPSDTDYLYFLSGDDDVTYFAKTEQEHQQNIENHCQKKCSVY